MHLHVEVFTEMNIAFLFHYLYLFLATLIDLGRKAIDFYQMLGSLRSSWLPEVSSPWCSRHQCPSAPLVVTWYLPNPWGLWGFCARKEPAQLEGSPVPLRERRHRNHSQSQSYSHSQGHQTLLWRKSSPSTQFAYVALKRNDGRMVK